MIFKIDKIITEDKTSKKTGKPYVNQFARLEINDEVRRVKIYRASADELYPVGKYELSPESFRVNDYGQLEIGFITLIPVKGVK